MFVLLILCMVFPFVVVGYVNIFYTISFWNEIRVFINFTLVSVWRSDPWTRSRKFSAGSRNSYERDQNEPNQNDAIRSRVRNNSSFNSYHDSGIVPDSNDCTGSLRYDQDGVFNDAFDIDGGSGGGRFQTRPWLSRKRISFKDELDAQKVAEMSLIEEKAAEPLARIPDDTTDPDQHPTPPLPKITKGNRLTTQHVNNDTENTSREKQSTSLLTPPEGKDSRMTAVSSNGNQRRKYGISGNHGILLQTASDLNMGHSPQDYATWNDWPR